MLWLLNHFSSKRTTNKLDLKTIVIFCIFTCSAFLTASSQEIQYGLKFKSNIYEPEERTSLNLSPDGYFSFPHGFSMMFDAKFRFEDKYSYGYIFRIMNQKGNSIDLVIISNEYIVFSTSTKEIVSNHSLSAVNIIPDKWLTFRLKLNISTEELELKIGEHTEKWKTPELKEFKNVEIVFGKINCLKNQVIDVPQMVIKNIEIANLSGIAQYSWKLSKHTSTGVYDEIRHHFAQCDNPIWIMDNNGIWESTTTFTTEFPPYLTYDSDKNILAVADTVSFYTLSTESNQLEKYKVNKRLEYKISANQMIYNSLDSSFYVYNLIKEGDAKEFTSFDFSKKEWGHTTPHKHNTDYRHHNRYFSPKYNRLFLFGGYGHLKYKEGVLIYDVNDKTWSKNILKGDRVTPRYLSGLGVIDEDHLLLFGGYGSETGNQPFQPQFYYDAFVINIQTMEARKIWTLNNLPENFVVSNSLVVDTTNNCFYALCYPSMKYNSAGYLYRFSMENPEYEILANKIPIDFKDIYSYVDLFLDNSNNKLIAAICSPNTEASTNVSVYTLSYPPLKHTDLYQAEKMNPKSLLIFLIILFCTIIASLLGFIVYQKRKKTKKSGLRQTKIKQTPDPVMSEVNIIRKPPNSSIILFGGFQVIDKDGNDISSKFKPLLKNLFLLILLYTIKNGKGISFPRLKDILWFDMTNQSANNNRGVALSKIRRILETVGDIDFKKKGTYWSVEFNDDVYCDYCDAVVLMKKIKATKKADINDIKQLLSVTSIGEFLPSIQTEWVDDFKSHFSNEFIDIILYIIRQENITCSDTLNMDIANALFLHDPLNEDGLKLKCRTLVKMGKNGLAINTYNAFIKEYAILFGTEYEYSFEQVIN